MTAGLTKTPEYSNLNIHKDLKLELPLFLNNMDEWPKKVPQLSEKVINSFGKVLDVFEEPPKLRDPEFDHSNLLSYDSQPQEKDFKYSEGFSRTDFKPPKLDIQYLGEMTKAHYAMVEPPEVSVGLEVEKDRMQVSASPCPEDIHLCGRCFVSIASVRCDVCMFYYCGICASNVHSDVLFKSHPLYTTKTNKLAQFYMDSDENVDLSISINSESTGNSYEKCEKHPKYDVKYACVTCNYLPVCQLCSSEDHKVPALNHKVIELEAATTEVKEFMNDCLAALVDRHNAMSPFLSELDQLCQVTEASVQSSRRSLNCALQGVLDAMKVKRKLVEGEIKNLQQVGTSNLNRLLNLSNTYNKYILGKIDQLKRLTNLKDPGLALNAFVELRANFEKLLYQNEDLPDLALEIPHWQLNIGNLPNLLSDVDYRITSRCEEMTSGFNEISEQTNKSASAIELVLESESPPEDSFSDVNLGQTEELNGEDQSELRGVFTRKDYVHRIPRKRAVTLRDKYLYVYSSDSHFELSPVESKIDLSAVTVKSLDEEDLTDVSKLIRVSSPNGFEIIEKKKGKVRFWIFTSESRNMALLWTAKLKRAVSQNHKVDLSYFGIDQNFVLPQPPKLPQEFKSNKLSEYCHVKVGKVNTNKPESSRPTFLEPIQDFRNVSKALKKIKEDSSLIYDKCFSRKNEVSPKNEPDKLKLELVHDSDHKAEIPDACSDPPSTISAGRYEMPSTRLEGRIKMVKTQPLPFKCVNLPKFEYSPQVTSPRSIHRFFEECSLS